jgi:hypothetical protein
VLRAPRPEARRVEAFDAGDERKNVQRKEDRDAQQGSADRAVTEQARRRGRKRKKKDDVERQVVGR